MTEKRRARRMPVSMRVETVGHPVVAFGYATNVSELGMAVDIKVQEGLEAPLPSQGAALRLKFMLPGSHSALSVRAEILRVETQETGPRLALAFQSLSPEDAAEIARYVECAAQTK